MPVHLASCRTALRALRDEDVFHRSVRPFLCTGVRRRAAQHLIFSPEMSSPSTSQHGFPLGCLMMHVPLETELPMGHARSAHGHSAPVKGHGVKHSRVDEDDRIRPGERPQRARSVEHPEDFSCHPGKGGQQTAHRGRFREPPQYHQAHAPRGLNVTPSDLFEDPSIKEMSSQEPRQEAAGSLMLRVIDHLFGSTLFHNDSAVHEHHAVSRLSGETYLMGDHHQGQPGFR